MTLKTVPTASELVTFKIALKMWCDEKLGEVHQAELSRVTEPDGSVYWEVDSTIETVGNKETTHVEFDTYEAAVEFYGDLAQITIYAQEG